MTTQSSAVREVQGAVQSAAQPEPDSSAQAGALRASSVPAALLLTGQDTPADTESDSAPGWRDAVRLARERAAGALGGLTSGDSLLHARPPSLAQAREHHHRAAGRLAPLWQWLRLAYGYWHLAVKAVTHAADWVTGSPPRLAVAALAAVICWHWH